MIASLCDMEMLNKIMPCYHAVHIFQIIGCIDFIKLSPREQLSPNIKQTLNSYINKHDSNIRRILYKDDIDRVNPIIWAGKITNIAFGIEIKISEGIPYIKSPWEWDEPNKIILLRNPEGNDDMMLPITKELLLRDSGGDNGMMLPIIK